MYNDKVLTNKQEVITTIADYMIPVDCCQKNEPVIKFTADYTRSKFEVFPKNKMDALHLNEIKKTEWIQILYE